jgi:hypothetical protein
MLRSDIVDGRIRVAQGGAKHLRDRRFRGNTF